MNHDQMRVAGEKVQGASKRGLLEQGISLVLIVAGLMWPWHLGKETTVSRWLYDSNYI